MPAQPDLLQTSLEVRVERKSAPSATFEFKIPSFQEDIQIGMRVKTLRKKLDPDWDGFEQGLDGTTMYQLRAAATLELLLLKSSETWPFTETPTGVVVDSAKFPPARYNDAILAYQGFLEALNTFRDGGAANQNAPGGENLASEPGS